MGCQSNQGFSRALTPTIVNANPIFSRWLDGDATEAEPELMSTMATQSRSGTTDGATGAMSAPTQRILGACGIGFVVIALVPLFVVPPAPPPDAGGEAMIAFYSAHRSVLLLTGWVRALGFPLSIVLLAGLVALMRRAEGEGGWLYLIFLMASLISISLAITLGAAGQLLYASSASSNPDVTKAISNLLGLGFALYFAPSIASWAAAGAVIARTAILPAWLGWWAWVLVAACLVASVGMLVESGPLTARGFGALAALFGQFGWYLAASIVIIARPRA